MDNKLVLGALAAVMAMSAGVCMAQGSAANYPAKPVTIISGTPPGGINEADGRLWAQKLGQSFGKPFVLEFKPGASSTIGANYVAKSAPDGHTLLIITGAFTIVAATMKDVPYDPLRDFAPVSLTLERPVVLLASPQLPANSLPEYIAYARSHPNEINFATPGAGTPPHMGGAWLHSASQTEVTFVHYKGSGPMLIDLASGRVHATASNIFNSLPLIKAGKAKAIAIMSSQRSSLLPNIKTVAEEGYPGFGYSSYGGILAPGATPPAVVNRLSAEFSRIVKEPDVVERLTKDGTVLVGSTPQAFRQLLVSELDRWKKLAQQYNIQAADD